MSWVSFVFLSFFFPFLCFLSFLLLFSFFFDESLSKLHGVTLRLLTVVDLIRFGAVVKEAVFENLLREVFAERRKRI